MPNMTQGNPLLGQITKKPDSNENTLYVGNVHPSMDDTRLFELFH